MNRCPKPPGQRTSDRKMYEDNHKTTSVGRPISGLYATATISGNTVDCLIDTGATLSLMSQDVWEHLKSSHTLVQYTDTLISASGDQLCILGKTRTTLHIQNTICTINIVIAKTDCDIILGLDFMNRFLLNIDKETKTCRLDGEAIQLQCSGRIGCYCITVAEDIEIPGMSEMILRGKLEDKSNTISSNNSGTVKPAIGMVEPVSENNERYNSMIARSVESLDKDVRCANF